MQDLPHWVLLKISDDCKDVNLQKNAFCDEIPVSLIMGLQYITPLATLQQTIPFWSVIPRQMLTGGVVYVTFGIGGGVCTKF